MSRPVRAAARVSVPACAALLALAPCAAGQSFEWIGAERWEHLRLQEITGQAGGPLLFYAPSAGRRLLDGTATPPPGWLEILPVEARLAGNSRQPWGWNDGPLWAGKGVSGDLSGGAVARWGPLTATLAPTVWFAQNASFDTVTAPFPDRDPLAYPWSPRIDWPQRVTDGAVLRISPGQSGVRLDWRAVTAGFSTENMVWGWAYNAPIIMGNTAEGLPHLDVGVRTTPTAVGKLEARVLWGRLSESGVFDTLPDNDGRLLAGMVFGWEPRWVPGLTLGFTRVFYQTWTDSLDAGDFFAIFQPFTKDALATEEDPEGNDIRDQMLSLMLRWVLPASGFEVYAEWARNDHNRDWRDFALEPDHSQAWMVGFQKALTSGDGHVRLRAEWTHLGRSATFQVRAVPTYYQHHVVTQGYTHRGQLLGAGIGPGSDSQDAGLERFHGTGSWGFWFQRVRWNDDAYYRQFAATLFREGHNVTFTLGGRYTRRLGRAEATVAAAGTRELNRHYRIGNDVWNVTGKLGLRWHW